MNAPLCFLHVTSGYYNTIIASFKTTPIRLDDPVKAAKPRVLSDHSGNGFLFSASINLHSLWDSCLPGVAGGVGGRVGSVENVGSGGHGASP